MERKIIIWIIKIILWIAGLYLSARFSLHTLYFIISGFYLMFTNLGKRKEGTLSAYSVFNQNFERLHGTMDPTEMFKGGMKEQRPLLVREKGKQEKKVDYEAEKEQYFKNQSKFGNKPCYCGSQIKFKKCCLVNERKRKQQQKQKRIKAL